jgi:hypothetical protein
MADLYIFSAAGQPHTLGPLPGLTACGLDLSGAQRITEAQAAVFLDDQRCHACFPHHKPRHQVRGGRHG